MRIKIKTPTNTLFLRALLKCSEMNIIPKVELTKKSNYLFVDTITKDVSPCDSESTFDKFEGLEFDIDKFFNLNLSN